MKFNELKKLVENIHEKKICIFGTAVDGCTWVFDVLRAMGKEPDFYCDNFKAPGMEIRDGKKIISPESLYSFHGDVYVFIAACAKAQKQIRAQLEQHGIFRMTGMDDLFFQTFIEDLLALNDPELNEKFQCVLDDKQCLDRQFQYYIGYQMDWNNPKTFNEKLQLLKLLERDPIYTKMVDKYEAKKIIADKIGAEYTIPTYGVYEKFDDIDFDKLPDQFVLKCTHDSGSIAVCKDKKIFDYQKARSILENGLKHNHYWFVREWVYKNVKPRIIAENYLEDKQDGELRDYKIFCFHGQVKRLLIAQGRMNGSNETTTDFFNEKLEHINAKSVHENAAVPPHMPKKYAKMKEIAEKLSAGIPHLRVDFYEVDEKIYVGELTFFHQGGLAPIEPYEQDLEMGSFIQLENI